MASDNRRMNLKETCPDDVRKMLIIWSRENVWKRSVQREYGEWKAGVGTEPTKVVLAKKANRKLNNVAFS